MINLTEKLNRLLAELMIVSPETYNHCQRVRTLTEYMVALGSLSGLTSYSITERRAIRKGALLHDIGKLRINKAILGKADTLTADEFAVMRCHARYSYELVQGELSDEERVIVEDICRYHHERIDRKGYERRKDVPLYVQIVSACDVYDALTSDRIYRKGMARDSALAIIETGGCGVMDPRLLALLRQTVKELDA